ncbi:hypothetical protein CDCA_CDCA17G4337 [Cyanidium caldarium]|uniref:Sucrose transporter n=1 Tax=Cyanidium caldarium TaxID=2771 RepID=A0AAV9J160_CYACA|nr:hypothetical protein CDCA_CDCA17G4337 [Cyanidium caldarium]
MSKAVAAAASQPTAVGRGEEHGPLVAGSMSPGVTSEALSRRDAQRLHEQGRPSVGNVDSVSDPRESVGPASRLAARALVVPMQTPSPAAVVDGSLPIYKSSAHSVDTDGDTDQLRALRERRKLRREQPGVPISRREIAGLTSIFAGIECVWSIIIARVTPLFRDMGVPEFLLSMVWLVGPLAGLVVQPVVQPVVGVLSDQCESRHGRRRPFIVGGAAVETVGMLLLLLFGTGESVSRRWLGMAMAFAGFTLVSIAHNTIQGPARALLVDLASADAGNERHIIDDGNAGFALWMSLGQGVGFLAGSIDWAAHPVWRAIGGASALSSMACNAACVNLRVNGAIALLVLLATTVVCCCVSSEVPRARDLLAVRGAPPLHPQRAVFKAFRFMRLMPTPMKRVCTVVLLSWVGFSQLFVHVTDWVGKDVGGRSAAPDVPFECSHYYEGVRYGTLGLFFNSVLASVASALLPRLTHLGGLRGVWTAGNALLAAALMVTPLVRGIVPAMLLIAVLGVPWAVTMSVPFSLIGMFSNDAERAVAIGVLNTYIVVPFIVVALLDGPLIVLLGGRISSVLLGGGVIAAVSCPLILRIPLQQDVSGHRVTLPYTPSLDSFRQAVQESSATMAGEECASYGSLGATSVASLRQSSHGGSRNRLPLPTLNEDDAAERGSTASPPQPPPAHRTAGPRARVIVEVSRDSSAGR